MALSSSNVFAMQNSCCAAMLPQSLNSNNGFINLQLSKMVSGYCYKNGFMSIKKNGWIIAELLRHQQGDTQLPSSKMESYSRRRMTFFSASSLLAAIELRKTVVEEARAVDYTDMPALRGKDYGKSKMRYPDYVETESGLQYKDLRVGNGPTPKHGEVVVIDWDGYTIGYYGRIFEARNKAKGGSFEGNEKGYLKFKLGGKEVISAFEEAIATMSVGGVRRIIVPPDLGYPDNDLNKMGPKPTTFSGQRALDFVLKNQGLIDKTLLFDIELLKINPS